MTFKLFRQTPSSFFHEMSMSRSSAVVPYEGRILRSSPLAVKNGMLSVEIIDPPPSNKKEKGKPKKKQLLKGSIDEEMLTSSHNADLVFTDSIVGELSENSCEEGEEKCSSSSSKGGNGNRGPRWNNEQFTCLIEAEVSILMGTCSYKLKHDCSMNFDPKATGNDICTSNVALMDAYQHQLSIRGWSKGEYIREDKALRYQLNKIISIHMQMKNERLNFFFFFYFFYL